MCGIAGAIGFVDESVRQAVKHMHAQQRHRGPDGEGFWSSLKGESTGQGAVLAHRRLAILDLSEHGAQPMTDPATGNVICYNGEVYNFKSIRSELAALGHHFESECDTEVILKAYAQWGLDSVHRFRGMFAFALWDARTKQLHLLRDRIGVKPVYYHVVKHGGDRQTVLFASELRALLASGLINRRLCPQGLSTYLWNGFVNGPHTIIQGVHELSAGHQTTLSADGVMSAPSAYWRTPDASYDPNAVEALQAELENSVRLRLISDVPLGVFLSGGVDSSAIAALAAKQGGEVHTFNIGFEESRYDESQYAQAVAKAIGAKHQRILLRQSDFKHQLSDALGCLDQPTFDAINTYFVSRAVREAGVTTALAGTGGDELFGGYRSFRDAPLAAKWGRRLRFAPLSLLRTAANMVTRIKLGKPGEVAPQTRWGKLADALAMRGDLVGVYQVAYGLFTDQFLHQLSDAAHADGVRFGLNSNRYEQLTKRVANNPPQHAICLLELNNFLGQRLLRDTDAASMAVSLEVRVPLLDHVMIERLAAVSPEMRFFPLGQKQLLRRLALSGLDPSIFDRPKSGFVLPIDAWGRQELGDQMTSTFTDASLCQRVGLQPNTVGRLWRSFQSGAPGVYWSRLWSLFVLINWCETHRVSR